MICIELMIIQYLYLLYYIEPWFRRANKPIQPTVSDI